MRVRVCVCVRACVCHCRTKDTLSAGNYLSVINILMQLRKVCTRDCGCVLMIFMALTGM